jgi:uncharacterized circularly permuted ATP-grasp superfamily protein
VTDVDQQARGVLGSHYDLGGFHDEVFEPGAGGDGVVPRPHYRELVRHLETMDPEALRRTAELANRSFLHRGVTFTVYSDDAQGTERILPFDPIPRLIPAADWSLIETGLTQRIRALNLFLHDIYHDQAILHDRVVPRQLVLCARHFRREVVGIDVPHDQYIHIVGSDLVRDGHGRYLVLEDNLRTPSGVSYVLANRTIMTRTFPDAFDELDVRPVDAYAGRLIENLRGLAPPSRRAAAQARPWSC